MNRHFSPRAIRRARWLDELHQALEQASLLLDAFAAQGHGGFSLAALQARVLAMHAEVELLNVVNDNGCRIIGPAWPIMEGTGALPS